MLLCCEKWEVAIRWVVEVRKEFNMLLIAAAGLLKRNVVVVYC